MTKLPPTPIAPPAPRPADLLTRPAVFFEALHRLPPSAGRYLWLVALASATSGISTTLLARHVLGAQSSILSGAAGGSAISPLFNYGSAAFASVFVTVLLWLALWGLGALGAGPAGRAAEVYGAAFLPTLIWAAVLLPVALLFAPQVAVAAPDLSGLSGAALQKALQTYILKVQEVSGGNPVNKVTTWLGYAVYLWQFALAFVGFRVLTGNQNKAWRGVLYPLALLLVLAAAAWLASKSVGSLLGG
ncbi:hypothetical protein GCM10022631_06900 [Deinococcus rubellus]|uniref:Yip1 domain-containing protein n=1 Tax=Deinococcus rubellus TaxID=1889240 RepID=A0ABY5YI75_9DEIO|nr:hypothetical protein [Deinococcus rubellus]UWX63969.1 hypothetical protein N0D28_14805 [Deinococcus rubellus]